MYSEEKIKEIEQSILSGMHEDDLANKEIEDAASEIAANLIKKREYKYSFHDKTYLFKVNMAGNKIVVVCADIFKYNVYGPKYIPFTANAERDERISMNENVAAIIRGLLGHITGRIKVEEVE